MNRKLYDKERYKNKKEHLNQLSKEYYQEHKGHLNKLAMEKYYENKAADNLHGKCDFCGKQMLKRSIPTHKKNMHLIINE